MRKTHTVHLLAGMAILYAASGVQAQAPAGAVVGTGSVTVKQKPSLLRMSIEIREKDKTAKQALQNLKDRLEAATLQLEALGAGKDSISVSPVTLPSGETDTEQQMRQMAMYQMRSQGRVPKALTPIKSVTVTSTVTAEWPLSMDSAEKLLVFVTTLKDKIDEADLAGLKEPKELTPEEEELQEEMAEMMSNYSYGEETAKPGEPQFLYVATLPEAQRKQAMTKAFAKAKANAQRLVDAAGAELGGLLSLSESTGEEDTAAAYQYMRYAMMSGAQIGAGALGDNESASQTPGLIDFRISVSAKFRLTE